MPRRTLPLVSPFGPAMVVDAATQATMETFRAQRSGKAAIELAGEAGAWAETLGEEVKARLPPSRPIACVEGCAHCCHVKVLVTVPEVLHLVAALRASLDAAALEQLRARVVASHRKTRGMSTEQRALARLPCPLLEGARCLAYDARPLACRGASSLDATACARAFDHPDEDVGIPIYKPQGQMTDALRSGLANGIAQSGLDPRLLELGAALMIALQQRTAGDEWASGRAAFAGAVDREFAELMRAHGGPGKG
jgi:hypothetical protein